MYRDKPIRISMDQSQIIEQNQQDILPARETLQEYRKKQLQILTQSIEQLRAPAQKRSKTRTTKKLIGLLIAHGSRSKRANAPKTAIKLQCFAPNGQSAINLYQG